MSALFLVLAVQFLIVGCSARIAIPEPRTPGYWKNHPEAWAIESITIGGVTYAQAEAIDILQSNAKDATYKLASHLIAAKLNWFAGVPIPTDVSTTISNADAFLIEHPLGSNPQGAERAYALSLKDVLDAFNNS